MNNKLSVVFVYSFNDVEKHPGMMNFTIFIRRRGCVATPLLLNDPI